MIKRSTSISKDLLFYRVLEMLIQKVMENSTEIRAQ